MKRTNNYQRTKDSRGLPPPSSHKIHADSPSLTHSHLWTRKKETNYDYFFQSEVSAVNLDLSALELPSFAVLSAPLLFPS